MRESPAFPDDGVAALVSGCGCPCANPVVLSDCRLRFLWAEVPVGVRHGGVVAGCVWWRVAFAEVDGVGGGDVADDAAVVQVAAVAPGAQVAEEGAEISQAAPGEPDGEDDAEEGCAEVDGGVEVESPPGVGPG